MLVTPAYKTSSSPLSAALQALHYGIRQRNVIVGIYGLPLALHFAQVGIKVIGFDIDPQKVELINVVASYTNALAPNTSDSHVQQVL